MVTLVNRYVCDLCQLVHETAEQAAACEALGIRDFEKPLSVGDIVTCGAYGWHDHWPTSWAIRRPAKRGEGTATGFWYESIWIISAIRLGHRPLRNDAYDRHLRRYHLFAAVRPYSTDPEVRTTSADHLRMTLIKPPRDVLMFRDEQRAQWEGKFAERDELV